MANSRVAQLYSDRFDGFGFLALGYVPPNPDFEIHKANAMAKERLGYEVLGYQIYHSEADTVDMIESHVRSLSASGHEQLLISSSGTRTFL
jgi:soluble epoxide hydrolase/lipid-phosphate phosphatase